MGHHFRVDIENDGEVFLLEKPIPIETLPGRILGHHRTPIEGYLPRPDMEYGPDATFLSPQY
jgi:hypothetical protein